MNDKKFSWSHSVLLVVVFIYVIINMLAIGCIVYCFANELYDYAVQIIIALFSFDGAISVIGVSFYEWKSKNENQAKINGAKYDKRLSLAMKICEYLKDDRLDVQSVALLKDIISDGQTSVSVNAGNGTITTFEDTKFSQAPRYEYTAEDILNEMDNTDGLG